MERYIFWRDSNPHQGFLQDSRFVLWRWICPPLCLRFVPFFFPAISLISSALRLAVVTLGSDPKRRKVCSHQTSLILTWWEHFEHRVSNSPWMNGRWDVAAGKNHQQWSAGERQGQRSGKRMKRRQHCGWDKKEVQVGEEGRQPSMKQQRRGALSVWKAWFSISSPCECEQVTQQGANIRLMTDTPKCRHKRTLQKQTDS